MVSVASPSMRAARASSASLPNVVACSLREAEVLVLQGVDHLVDEDALGVVALDVVVEEERLLLDVVIALDARRVALAARR